MDGGSLTSGVDVTLQAIRRGETALIYELRGKASGLICVATHSDIAYRLGLPLMTEILEKAACGFPLLSKIVVSKTPYGDQPAFTNHKPPRHLYRDLQQRSISDNKEVRQADGRSRMVDAFRGYNPRKVPETLKLLRRLHESHFLLAVISHASVSVMSTSSQFVLR